MNDYMLARAEYYAAAMGRLAEVVVGWEALSRADKFDALEQLDEAWENRRYAISDARSHVQKLIRMGDREALRFGHFLQGPLRRGEFVQEAFENLLRREPIQLLKLLTEMGTALSTVTAQHMAVSFAATRPAVEDLPTEDTRYAA